MTFPLWTKSTIFFVLFAQRKEKTSVKMHEKGAKLHEKGAKLHEKSVKSHEHVDSPSCFLNSIFLFFK